MSFSSLPYNFCVIELALCYQSMASTHLVEVVIIEPTRTGLISWATFSHGVVTIVAAQAKDDFKSNRFSTDMFLPLVVEVFKCLHQ
jgi:hypothetical protein